VLLNSVNPPNFRLIYLILTKRCTKIGSKLLNTPSYIEVTLKKVIKAYFYTNVQNWKIIDLHLAHCSLWEKYLPSTLFTKPDITRSRTHILLNMSVDIVLVTPTQIRRWGGSEEIGWTKQKGAHENFPSFYICPKKNFWRICTFHAILKLFCLYTKKIQNFEKNFKFLYYVKIKFVFKSWGKWKKTYLDKSCIWNWGKHYFPLALWPPMTFDLCRGQGSYHFLKKNYWDKKVLELHELQIRQKKFDHMWKNLENFRAHPLV
jgi:hypothetical protein